jgi:hypothetical protein
MTIPTVVALHTHEAAASSGISEMTLMWALMALMVVCEVSMLWMMRAMHRRISTLEDRNLSS